VRDKSVVHKETNGIIHIPITPLREEKLNFRASPLKAEVARDSSQLERTVPRFELI